MKSFLQGKKEVTGVALHAPVRTLQAAGGMAAAAAPTVPGIEVVKEGEKVVRLIVTCACGERLEVECLYRAC
jgi:hypothetical protein